jgi:hypothetical protein
MGEQRAVGESIVSNQADGINLGIDCHLPITPMFFVCIVFVQITLYTFIIPHLDITSANLTLSLRQL